MSDQSASPQAQDGGADANAADGGPAIRRLADWNADDLVEHRRQYGSPLYVLDLDRVRENYRRIAGAFPAAEIRYAAKANALGKVLTALADEGAGVECASAGETVRALDADVPSEHVHYTAVNPPASDLDTVVELWNDGVAADLTVTVGAADTVDRLAKRGFDGDCCVRVNPGIGAGHHEKVQTGAEPKFGVPLDRALDVADRAATADMNVVGVHAHAGSGIHGEHDLAAHREMVARVGDVAREFVDAHAIEFVDVGGGLGVPYREDEPPLDLDAVADATRDALGDVDAQLVLEPGRYLVADAGVLLTDVNTVKTTPSTTVVGVDAGMTTLARPAIYDAYHALRNLSADVEAGEEADDTSDPNSRTGDTDRADPGSRTGDTDRADPGSRTGDTDRADPGSPSGDGRGEVRATVAGPICETADVFAEDRPLATPRRGDVLALGNAGAYGYEMASNYNSRPRPATAVVDDGTVTLARRRESLADVTDAEL
jgi:diaminopimelate decarboxylase